MTLFLLTLLVAVTVLWLLQLKKNRAQQADHTRARAATEQQLTASADREAQLAREVEQLANYQPVVDVKRYAQQLRATADTDADILLSQASGKGRIATY